MNIITKYLKKRKKTKEYSEYILNHQKNVLRAYHEMLHCEGLEWIILDREIYEPLWQRALDHDDSKWDKEEFDAYRKYFYPIDEEEKESAKEEFEAAWEHHWKNNDHHWQHRVNWKDEDFNINTELACLENIMDWLAMGYEFNDRPYQYYEKHKDEITLSPKQKAFIEKCIYAGVDRDYIIANGNDNVSQ